MSEHSSTPSRPASPVGPLPDLSHSTIRPFRFNWDTSSRRRGPGSVSETTEGRGGDYFAAPPRVDIPNPSNANIVLGALPQEWSSSTQGFNAISTVLNNPHKRQAPPKAHSSVPPIIPAELPRVKRKDFDPYLCAIAPEWDRFVRNTQSGRDAYAQMDGTDVPRTSSEIPLTPRTPPIGRLLTPLNTVPSVFFDSTFDLGNPHIFNAVIERQEGDEDTWDPSSLSYSLPLLERLSHHADTVEQHLVREISIRSTSFFAALTNLQDLQTESEECLKRISTLRGLLMEVDHKGAKGGLEIVRKENGLMNLGTVCESSKQLGTVVDMSGIAKGLVGAGQWGEALDVIDSIQLLWDAPADAPLSPPLRQLSGKGNGKLSHTSPSDPLDPQADQSGIQGSTMPSIPLSSLNAFASLPEHLRALTMEITSSLVTDLVNVLKLDLLERVHQNSEPIESTMDVNLTLKDRLRPLLHGLVRTKGMREAIVSWGEVVTKEVKGIIKHRLPSFDADEEDGDSNGTSILPSILRSKTHAEFLSIISQVYKNLLNGIEGLQIQNGIVVDVLESQQVSTLSLDLPFLQDELSDILSSTADLSNKLAAKVIGCRSEQHANLDLPSFLAFFNESWDFVLKCEIICRRVIVGLRGVVLGQAKLFLQAFHQGRINQSAKLVEDEQWSQIEVQPALQHLVDVLVDSAVRDSPDLIIGGNASLPSPATPSANGTNPSLPSSPRLGRMNGSATSGSLPSKCLRIEERPYFCVSATGAVLGLLLDYLKLVVNLSTLNTDTMSRVIEFLKAFNSRTCQVVLGAGAMRSAGLKNITAKHLALASQSLSIMVVLIPYVRETFRRHLSPNQAVMLVEFDKLKRDFQEHQNEIHSKLIAIMGDRISAHVRTLQAVNWEIPKQGDSVNDYMELLVKETVTLHKVLSRYLSAPIVEYVMSQVFAAINHRLLEEYSRIELQSREAKDRMLADARFLHQKLSVLKNIGAPTNMLETLVTEKLVPRHSELSNLRAMASPNERIKGLLSRRDGVKPDKPLPSPAQTTSPAPSPTPSLAQATNAIGASPGDGGEQSDNVIPPGRGSSLDPGSRGDPEDEGAILAEGSARNSITVVSNDRECSDARGTK